MPYLEGTRWERNWWPLPARLLIPATPPIFGGIPDHKPTLLRINVGLVSGVYYG